MEGESYNIEKQEPEYIKESPIFSKKVAKLTQEKKESNQETTSNNGNEMKVEELVDDSTVINASYTPINELEKKLFNVEKQELEYRKELSTLSKEVEELNGKIKFENRKNGKNKKIKKSLKSLVLS